MAVQKMIKGRTKMYLWPGREGDGNECTSTPFNAAILDESDRLRKCVERYEKGKMITVNWLDPLSLSDVKREHAALVAQRSRDVAFLFVEFQSFRHRVIFHEKEYVTHVDESEGNKIVHVFDPEMALSNLCDEKHQRMQRYKKGMDGTTKPTNQQRKELAKIVSYPPTKTLTDGDKNLMWMFRSYLTGSVSALPKFLLSVDWSFEAHATEAVKLMHESWTALNIEVALELLSEHFPDPRIRHHVVAFLEGQSDSEVIPFLIQLVQAMRSECGAPKRTLTDFLMRRACQSLAFGTPFIWYMKVEGEKSDDDGVWYRSVVEEFLETLQVEEMRDVYRRQDLLVRTLRDLYRHITETAKNREQMIDVLRKEIASGHFGQLRQFAALPFPLNPALNVVGMIPEKCTVFKSAKKPLGLCFQLDTGAPYMVLFKVGDDLRCDQLVLQIVSLMDSILKKDGNLDLKLSPYRVLATGRMDGMLEIVPESISVAACLKEYDNDIALYYRKLHPSSSAPLGIAADCLDSFVRSCAGYCVITYLLGVGDRHLDNLLLTKDGRLFHIDFGFILGEDPKWPVPMKITKEMVLAMGGDNSPQYYQFKNLCCEAFTFLRRKSNLVITLFGLMMKANIINGHKVMDNADDLFKIQHNYCLDLSEELSIAAIQALIQRSVSALLARFLEDVHSVAQYMRN